jgi:hypothetical protein
VRILPSEILFISLAGRSMQIIKQDAKFKATLEVVHAGNFANKNEVRLPRC